MKKLLLMFAAAGFAALTSCGGNEPVPEPPITLIGGRTNQNGWGDQTTGTGQVSFETTASWTSSITEVGATRDTAPGVPATWVTITPSSGAAGSHSVTIVLEDNFTGSDRTATITINCDGGKITITITQKATLANGDPHVDVPPVTDVALETYAVTVAVGETVKIPVIVSLEDADINSVRMGRSASNDVILAYYDYYLRSLVVTGLGVGEGEVYAILGDETSPHCIVTVVEPDTYSDDPNADPDGVMIGGVVWANRNVRAKGQFVETPEDYGGFFSFVEAQTVCPEGWRTPTAGEFHSLIASGSTGTTLNDVKGCRFGRGDATIFIPVGGLYYLGGELQSHEYEVRLWTATSTGPSAAFALEADSRGGRTNVLPYSYASIVRDANRLSVRCVR